MGFVDELKVLNSHITQCSDVTKATAAATAVIYRHLQVKGGATR